MLGIFQRKKAKRNRLILKSLITGPKTTTQIAEYIYLNQSNIPLPKLNKNEVKSLVSQIVRKGSRLSELEAKHYIFKMNKVWQLTIKGACVALTQITSIEEVYPLLQVNSLLNAFEKDFRKHPVIKLFVDSSLLKEAEISKVFEFGKSPRIPQLFKDYTNELIRMGVDLDKVSDDEFALQIINKGIGYFLETEISELTEALKKNT